MRIEEMNYPVAQNIKRVIDEKGLKKMHIASRCGISEGTLSRMLNGKCVIRPYHIVLLASALGVAPQELFKP